MPDCSLRVFDGSGLLARDLQVQVPDTLDTPTLMRIHQRCMDGLTCSYAVLERDWTVQALFLHRQLLPERHVVLGTRRRAPGRWITGTVPIGPQGGGRAALGPEVFFRQADLDSERAWVVPLLLRLQRRHPSTTPGRETAAPRLWAYTVDGARYFYQEQAGHWQLFGAGNTPEDRLRAALDDVTPETIDDHLWARGAVPLGPPPRRFGARSTGS